MCMSSRTQAITNPLGLLINNNQHIIDGMSYVTTNPLGHVNK